MRTQKFFNIFFMFSVLFLTINTEASEWTSVVVQHNPTSYQEAEKRRDEITAVLEGRQKGLVKPAVVFRVLRLEHYEGLTAGQILVRLRSARVVKKQWKGGQMGIYAFHKTTSNRTKVSKRSNWDEFEWVLDDGGVLVMSLYCGNPLQDNRHLKQSPSRRVTTPTWKVESEVERNYSPPPQRVARRTTPPRRRIVEVTPPQNQTQTIIVKREGYGSNRESSGGLMNLLAPLAYAFIGNNGYGGFLGGGAPVINSGFPVTIGGPNVVYPGQYLPQALGAPVGGVVTTTAVPATPVATAPVATNPVAAPTAIPGGPLGGLP